MPLRPRRPTAPSTTRRAHWSGDQDAHLELAREIVAPEPSLRRLPSRSPSHLRSPVIRAPTSKQDEQIGGGREAPPTRRRCGSRHVDWSPTPSASCARRQADPECATSASCTDVSPTDYELIWDGDAARTGCVDTKKLLLERLLAFFGPARERRAELAAKPGYVEEVLHAGADKLAPLAAETMRAVHDRMGLA